MRYADNVDYLLASILYLGVHGYWWARSAQNMATELGLDESRLERVFNGFPGIFRKSKRLNSEGKPFYALQLRYAQRADGSTEDPDQVSNIPALDNERVQILTNFVAHMAEQEQLARRGWVTLAVSLLAAILAATAVVTAAILKVTPTS